ncbi:MAG: endonuclease/exonuclease/phosphatase family protein [Spirochaetota bacterium]
MDSKNKIISRRRFPSFPYILKKMSVFLSIPLIFLTLISCARCSFPGVNLKNGEVTILSYNVENLFDDADNGSEYPEFDPGSGEWTTEHFHQKMLNIAEVIERVVSRGPDIVALQEVENGNTLETLNEYYLKTSGYRYSACSQSEGSAVNVAFLSKYPIVRVFSHRIQVDGVEGLRNLLEAEIECRGRNLILFNNHWKSRSGGVEETEYLRIEASSLLVRRIKEILSENPDADIIVVGDLNESADEYIRMGKKYQTALLPIEEDGAAFPGHKSLYLSPDPAKTGIAGDRLVLYTTWSGTEGEGSYAYRNIWETIDHIMLSPGLFDDNEFTYKAFRVVKEEFMLTGEGFPLRWNSKSMKGYSDHLPLLVTLY